MANGSGTETDLDRVSKSFRDLKKTTPLTGRREWCGKNVVNRLPDTDVSARLDRPKNQTSLKTPDPYTLRDDTAGVRLRVP